MKGNLRDQLWTVTRRDFLKASAAFTTAGLFTGSLSVLAGSTDSEPIARFGIVTDLHYADTDSRGTRFYRESIPKMAECVELMNAQNADFLVELGDFKDQDTPADESATLRYLRDIETVFRKFNGPRYHVLGNHDVDSISKAQFLSVAASTGIPADKTWYSFDKSRLHFVVLDANFSADGSHYDHGGFDWKDANLPDGELRWLEQDLGSTSLPVIVFIHQLLDGEGEHFVNNATEVREIFQKHGNVLAVFQGHKHTGDYSFIEGIHYYTLKAMVEGSGEENSSYAVVEVNSDKGISVTGYRKAVSRELP